MAKQEKFWLTVRLTAAERDLLDAAAKRYGMSVQKFIVAAAEENAKRILDAANRT